MINKLDRLSTESIEEYCMRICSLKDDLDVSWQDIADFLNEKCGFDYSKDTYRKRYSKFASSYEVTDELQNELIELKKEKIKLAEERTQINSLVRSIAREETLKEIAADIAESISSKKLLARSKGVNIIRNTDVKGILVISDWHYGVEVSSYYNTYNTDIAKERINKLLDESIRLIKSEHISELFVLNLGDMISGIIHLPLRLNSRIDVITQTIEVSEILVEFLTELTNHCNIRYGSVSDNHSRLDPNKKEALQVESFTRIIDWYLKKRLEENENIEFLDNKYGDDICSFDIFDFKVLAVHGDKDPQKKILTQLVNFTQEHYDIVLSAHKHHFFADEQNETELYSNGSLMGTDDYAIKLRCNNKPSQLLIVCDKENISRNIYKIKL
jgi:hypothetical protein